MMLQCNHCKFTTAYRTSMEAHLRTTHGITFRRENQYCVESIPTFTDDLDMTKPPVLGSGP